MVKAFRELNVSELEDILVLKSFLPAVTDQTCPGI